MIKKPTLEKVKKDMDGMPYELIMFCYHKLNDRDEEAQTYLESYKEEQILMKTELMNPQIIEETMENDIIKLGDIKLDNNIEI